jgi:hypothetical protein
MPVDSGLLRLCRRSEIAPESGMISLGIGRRHREADPDYFNKARRLHDAYRFAGF